MMRWRDASAHGKNNLDSRSSALARGHFRVHWADNPQAAIQTVNGIYDRTQALANFPEMGHRYWASARHVRILLYGHYRIAYLIKNDGDIEVLGVFHGSLDISRYQL